MGTYKYIRDLWKRPKANMPELFRQRLLLWRREPATVRLEHPTRLDRARSLGYKAKQGYFIVRQRVLRGGHTRPKIIGGRKPKSKRQRLALEKNYRQIAEERVHDQFNNCEVLNSYFLVEDGKHKWFEVILVDISHPAIQNDNHINWICDKHGRAERGLTSAGRKSRGLRHNGKGAEKMRPSKHARGY